MPIPDLPGRLIPRHSDEENWLKAHVRQMCKLENDRSVSPIDPAKARKRRYSTNGPFRFPGSQPVSFGAKDLAKLENQE